MNKKQKRQSRNLIVLIVSLLLVASLITALTYSFIAFRNKRYELINDADIEMLEIMQSLSDNTEEVCGFDDYLSYFLSQYNSNDKYIEIRNYNNTLLASSENTCVSNISEKEGPLYVFEKIDDNTWYFRITSETYIRFDSFRKSMTDEQYNEIVGYLCSEAEEDDMYYELVCTEFYATSRSYEVIPKQVEIVKTRSSHTWHLQDIEVKAFDLEPVKPDGYTLCHISDTYRNVIDTDFVLNKYDNSELRNFAKDLPIKFEQEIIKTDAYTFVYMNNRTYHVISNNSGVNYQLLRYVRSFNLLDECKNEIIKSSIVIFAFYISIALILSVSVICVLNSRIKQERKRTEMTNAFAHNIKTPLQIISGFSENLSKHIESDSNKYYIDIIKEQAFSIDEQVHRMLDYSRLDSDKIKPNKASFLLDDLLGEILEKYKNLSEKEINVTSDNSSEIVADRELLRLATENLIENAIKYSADGAVHILIKNNYFEISNACEDISNKNIKELWKPYYRRNRNSEKGNGVGLSIVKSVFNLHRFKYGAKLNDNIITFWFKY